MLVHLKEVADIAVTELEHAQSLGDLESQQVTAFVQVVRGGGRSVGGIEVASADLVELGDQQDIHLTTGGFGEGFLGRGEGADPPRWHVTSQV